MEGRRKGGGHQAYVKSKLGGGHWTVIVVRGEREIKHDTLDSILEQAGMTYEEFEVWARIRRKGRPR